MQVRDGRPIVDGVYVNGRGPYRFLLDTGANVNLIETGLARKDGMSATFQVDFASAVGNTPMAGSDGNEIALHSVKAKEQKFLFSGLDAFHIVSPDAVVMPSRMKLNSTSSRRRIHGTQRPDHHHQAAHHHEALPNITAKPQFTMNPATTRALLITLTLPTATRCTRRIITKRLPSTTPTSTARRYTPPHNKGLMRWARQRALHFLCNPF